MAGLTREMSSHKVAVWQQLCTSKERTVRGGSRVRGSVEVAEELTKYYRASWTRDLGRTTLFCCFSPSPFSPSHGLSRTPM